MFGEIQKTWPTDGGELLKLHSSGGQNRTEFHGNEAELSVARGAQNEASGRTVIDGECRFDAAHKRTGPMSTDFVHLYPSDSPTASDDELNDDREERVFSLFEALYEHGCEV